LGFSAKIAFFFETKQKTGEKMLCFAQKQLSLQNN